METSFDGWIICIIVYLIIAALSFMPVVIVRFRKIEIKDKDKNPFSEDKFPHKCFNEGQRLRLNQHHSRIVGTLKFWEKTALWNKYFHYYVLCWTLPISIIIPVMVAFIDIGEYNAKLFLTIISLHSALALGFHRALKVENNYKSFRQGESEFYDLHRRFLDMPGSFGEKSNECIYNYFAEVEHLRKFVRAAETDNFPAVDDKTGANMRDSQNREIKE